MDGRKTTRVDKGEGADGRRCHFTLDARIDERVSVYARRHKLTRSQVANQAFAALTRGIRIGFGAAPPGEEETPG
jgi:hypothetical protein